MTTSSSLLSSQFLARFTRAALILLATHYSLLATPVTIQNLTPTVLFNKDTPASQIAWLDLQSTAAENLTLIAVTKIDGKETPRRQILTVPPGASTQNLFIPDIAGNSTLTLDLLQNNASIATITKPWQHQRKWKVYLVKASHEDIGYEDFLWMKQKEIADFIDLGGGLSKPPAKGPAIEGARTTGGYHYFLESLLFLRYYEDERGIPETRKLISTLVSPNHLPIAGAPNGGMHFHWMDTEEMARTMYPAKRLYKDRYGLDPDTYLSIDNPSISWAGAQALHDAGFKYAVRFGQPFRTGGLNDYASTKLPAIFFWKLPDQKSQILYTWRHHYGLSFWFGQTTGGYKDLSNLAVKNVQDELAAVENGILGPYPYDALMIPSYQDHEIPVWDNRALKRWQARFSYPEIIITGPSDFMGYIEKNFSQQIPTLSGDLNNNSADYSTIDPESQGWKRTAARQLPVAETLNVLNNSFHLNNGNSTLLPNQINRAYLRLFDFDEHSWPTSPRAGDVHRFNAQWGKRLEGRRALDDANTFLNQTFATFATGISTGDKQTLLVFNPSAQPRTGIVSIKTKNLLSLSDTSTKQPVQTQYHQVHKSTVFVAENIPPLGYKTFELTAETPIDFSIKPTSSPAKSAPVLENKFYKITLDKSTGAITSIYDKELKRELVDQKAAQQFNQAVLVSKKSKDKTPGTTYSPKSGAVFETAYASGNPVYNQISATITDKTLGDATLRQSVRLYENTKLIEIINSISHLGVLHSDQHTDRYKENLFYAFPLDVPNFTHRADQAIGTVRPFDDQLRFGTHDYLMVNRALQTSNNDFTVTIAPREASAFHLGAIRYNEFSNSYKPKTSHVFSYAWSNRMAGLLAITPNDLRGHLHYTITSSSNNGSNVTPVAKPAPSPNPSTPGAAAPSPSALSSSPDVATAVANPLLATLLPAKQNGSLPATASFLSINQPNIRLTVLKQSEQPGRGLIIRLVETNGTSTTATLNLTTLLGNSTHIAATLTDLVENDTQPLQIKNGTLTLPINGNSTATLRLFNNSNQLPAPGTPTAQTTGDSTIQLSWAPVTGATSYNIYRSTDPDDPAGTSTLVAQTGTSTHTDTNLDPDTTYYYRLAALLPLNTQGVFSEKITATTSDKNTTPPPPVGDFGIVRLTPTSHMVCWAKSTASDIASYQLLRSEKSNFSNPKPIAVLRPSGYYVEHFIDTNLTPGKTYYYRVLPKDYAGNIQPNSPTAQTTTPKPD